LIEVNPEAIFRILFINIFSLGSKNESFSMTCKEKSHIFIMKTKHGQRLNTMSQMMTIRTQQMLALIAYILV
jgi:hypothetical protein